MLGFRSRGLWIGTASVAAALALAAAGLSVVGKGGIARRPRAADYSGSLALVKHRLATIPESAPDRMRISLSDLRSCDLRDFDLSAEGEALSEASFDSRTLWPRKIPLKRNPALDQDDFAAYSIIPWKRSLSMVKKPLSAFDRYYEEHFDSRSGGSVLLVPINSRTSASPTGPADYAFSREGGWSMVPP